MFCSQLKRKHVALQRRSNLSSAEEQWHGHCAPCSGSEWTRRGEGPQRLPELPLAIWCHVVCIYECALVRYVYIILYIYWYWNIHLSNIYMYNYIIIYIYPEDASHRFMNLSIYIYPSDSFLSLEILPCSWQVCRDLLSARANLSALGPQQRTAAQAAQRAGYAALSELLSSP
jgi:hypothetical protein